VKILVAADMEGICGVVHWDHVAPSHPEHGRFRRLMSAEANAAALGALAGGADDVVITDGHNDGCNSLIEELDPRVRLHCGSPHPLSMVQGVAEGVDGAVFVGYHARAGTPQAVLDHTWGGGVHGVWVNGTEVGEIGLNAAVCAHFGVPVVAVCGCQAACAEATQLLGPVETAAVKRATARGAAECLSPEAAQALVRQAAERGVARLAAGRAPAPWSVAAPVELTVAFIHSQLADRAALLPLARRDGRRVSVTAESMPVAYGLFRTLMNLT